LAAVISNVKTVKYLVEKDANPKAKTKTGFTTLHAAARNPDVDVIKYILPIWKNDTEIKTNNGETPLFCAWNLDAMKFLISKGANINAKNENGDTPLHFFAKGGNEKIEHLQYLIDKKADVNAKNEDDNTPFDFAGTDEKREILIEAGGKSGKGSKTKRKSDFDSDDSGSLQPPQKKTVAVQQPPVRPVANDNNLSLQQDMARWMEQEMARRQGRRQEWERQELAKAEQKRDKILQDNARIQADITRQRIDSITGNSGSAIYDPKATVSSNVTPFEPEYRGQCSQCYSCTKFVCDSRDYLGKTCICGHHYSFHKTN
jgi:hypothetical protein